MLGARWNSPGRRVIYAAETFAGTLLEQLVHASIGRLPTMQRYVEITIPAGVSVEEVSAEALPGWDDTSYIASREYGDRWYDERRSLILLVPSVVTNGVERNVMIHQEHPEFARVTCSEARPVRWDARLQTPHE